MQLLFAHGRKPTPAELGEPASLLLPEGTYGPAFLTLKNYYVIKEYNFSDLYVLFVGHLSDRISDPRPFETPWSKNTQLRTAQVETMQRTLTKLGLYKDKIDGKAGMLTRSALGAYQKANQLKVDCWPTAVVVDDKSLDCFPREDARFAVGGRFVGIEIPQTGADHGQQNEDDDQALA